MKYIILWILLAILVLLAIILTILKLTKVIDFYDGKWVKVLDDNFDSLSNWNIYTDADPTHSCAIYSDNQGVINANGQLEISMKPAPKGGFYTGRIVSKSQYGPYGYYEAKVRIDGNSDMLWPAFWLTPTNGKYGGWPKSGEIDIMETINNNGTNLSSVHCGNGSNPKTAYEGIKIGTKSGINFQNFNIFACNWTPQSISVHIIDGNSPGGPSAATESNKIGSVDASQWADCGTQIKEPSPAPFDVSTNIIFNMAIGGDYAGAVGGQPACGCTTSNDDFHSCIAYDRCTKCKGVNINAKMIVDWCRVWQLVQ